MDEQNSMMSPDEEVAMLLSSDRDNGPTTRKRAKIMTNSQAGSSRDYGECSRQSPSQSRSMGSSRHPWDESSDSNSSQSSFETGPNVYPSAEAYLSSIPKFNEDEHQRIPMYMDILGDNVKEIKTNLPKCSQYTEEQMEVFRRNYVLSQLDFLIRENVRRTTKENQKKETKRLSLIKKPVPIMPNEKGYLSE